MIGRALGILLLVIIGFFAGMAATAGRAPAPVEDRVRSAPPAAIPTDPARTPGAILDPASPPAAAPQSSPTAVAIGPDFTTIAGHAVKAVVNISSVQVVRRQNSPFGNDPFFEYFFGGQDPFESRARRSLSLGSGVIVSADGYVVTNNHVVGENVREIKVALSDKREVPARIVGVDPATDIALVQMDLKGLPAVPWGDSSLLKVGEWVLAIGSPFQLSQTVTAGIVSAVGRANVGFADYEDFIQTDAAINPGNSGGALINTRGELVGINTGIFSQSGGYQGIGFAVPSNLVRHVVDDLKNYGEVRRGTIGGILTIERVTPEYARELGAPTTDGALVMRMRRDSQAYEAGVRAGDIIVRFNNTAIEDPSQLYRLVADAPIGSTATIRVLRNGRTIDFRLPIVSVSTVTTAPRRAR
jgi:serine protease Do